jgi:hypothetical protein
VTVPFLPIALDPDLHAGVDPDFDEPSPDLATEPTPEKEPA